MSPPLILLPLHLTVLGSQVCEVYVATLHFSIIIMVMVRIRIIIITIIQNDKHCTTADSTQSLLTMPHAAFCMIMVI